MAPVLQEPRVWWRDRYVSIWMLRSFAHAARSSSKAEEAQRRTWDGLGLVVVTEVFTEEAALESWHRNGYIQVDWKSHGT